MSKNNSSGHLLNVNNFNVMISRIITFGEAFQPSRESLTVQGLQSLLKKSEDTLASVSAAEVNEMNIIAARQNAFQPLDSLVTRSISALRITDVLPETLAQAESMLLVALPVYLLYECSILVTAKKKEEEDPE